MIIHLIRALYDPQTPLPSEEEFYEQALEDIRFFSVSPQIYYLAKQRGVWEKTPSFFRGEIERRYSEALYQSLLVKNQTEQILKKLDDAGVEAIPLKGASFAEKYFGHFGARGTSDIDLMVRAADLEKAIACVHSLGYSLELERIRSHFHRSFSKPLPQSSVPLTVELHWNLLKENTSDLPIEDFWDQAVPMKGYRHIKELSDYHTFYMICLHGWRHNLGSMKYFLDIVQLIHILWDKFEYSSLLEDAAAHKTSKRLQRTLAIVYKHFPHLARIKTLPMGGRTKLRWEYSALRGLEKRTFRDYLNWVYYEFFDYDTAKHGIAAFYDYIRSLTTFGILIKKKKENG